MGYTAGRHEHTPPTAQEWKDSFWWVLLLVGAVSEVSISFWERTYGFSTKA